MMVTIYNLCCVILSFLVDGNHSEHAYVTLPYLALAPAPGRLVPRPNSAMLPNAAWSGNETTWLACSPVTSSTGKLPRKFPAFSRGHEGFKLKRTTPCSKLHIYIAAVKRISVNGARTHSSSDGSGEDISDDPLPDGAGRCGRERVRLSAQDDQ